MSILLWITNRLIVQYVADHWLAYRSYQLQLGLQMNQFPDTVIANEPRYTLNRLQLEMDFFILRATKWILIGHKYVKSTSWGRAWNDVQQSDIVQTWSGMFGQTQDLSGHVCIRDVHMCLTHYLCLDNFYRPFQALQGNITYNDVTDRHKNAWLSKNHFLEMLPVCELCTNN